MNEKPIQLLRQEFLESLVTLINECHLPAFVLLDIFRDLSRSFEQASQVELERAKEAFEGNEEK